MGKIHIEFETEYETGDIVVFIKESTLLVGIIEGYYLEDNCIWYNIRTSRNNVFTYSNGGDIGEFDILMKLPDSEKIARFIEKGDIYE